MKKRKKVIIILSFACIIMGFFMALLDTTIVNISLPKMAEYFNCTVNDITWVVNSYNIALVVFMLTASRIADQFGRKRLFIIGIAIFVITSCLIGFSSNLLMIIILRIIQGLSASIIIPVTIPLVFEIVPEEKFGAIIGAWGALAGLATACGPALGGNLTFAYNWQSIFFVNLPFGIITIILAYVVLDESYDNTSSRYIDIKGILSISLAILAVTLGLIQGPDEGWFSIYILSLFAICIVSIIVFILAELKSKEPMLPLWLMKIRAFSASNIAIVFATSMLMAGSFLVPFYLTKVLEMTQKDAGMVVVFMPIGMIILSTISGPLSQKFGSKFFGVIGLTLSVLALFSMGSLQYGSSKGALIIRLLVLGAGLGMTIAPIIGGAVTIVPKDKIGVASAVTNIARTFGMILGVAILTTILNINVKASVGEITNAASKIINEADIDDSLKSQIISDISNKNNSGDLLVSSNVVSNNDISNKEREKVGDVYAKVNEQIKLSDFECYMNTFKVFSYISVIGIAFAFYSEDRKKTVDSET